MPQRSDLRIAAGQLVGHFDGCVGGAVVYNDQFKLATQLRQDLKDPLDRRSQRGLIVLGGQQNTERPLQGHTFRVGFRNRIALLVHVGCRLSTATDNPFSTPFCDSCGAKRSFHMRGPQGSESSGLNDVTAEGRVGKKSAALPPMPWKVTNGAIILKGLSLPESTSLTGRTALSPRSNSRIPNPHPPPCNVRNP